MTSVLARRGRHTISVHVQKNNHVKKQQESGIWASKETKLAYTLILDFQPSEVWEKKFKPPPLVCGIFVMAALGN